MPERIAVYPGTFDPVTTGHLDIIQRATRICDRLVVGIADNVDKRPLFTPDERADMVQGEIDALAGKLDAAVEVQTFAILLTKFVDEVGGSIIVRGLRAVTDFDYEFQMAGMNARLRPDIETVFLAASPATRMIASSLVKQIAKMGGDISTFVPEAVHSAVMETLKTK